MGIPTMRCRMLLPAVCGLALASTVVAAHAADVVGRVLVGGAVVAACDDAGCATPLAPDLLHWSAELDLAAATAKANSGYMIDGTDIRSAR